MASAYHAHLSGLFASSSTPAYASRDLKRAVSRHSDQFSVYAQQDAQEFLGALLDALHEDLNRVVEKPGVPNPEWGGGGEAEVLRLGEQFWEAYKQRNDSVVVDLFQGQYKSEIVCSQCQHVGLLLRCVTVVGAEGQLHRRLSPLIRTCTCRPPYRWLVHGLAPCFLCLGTDSSHPAWYVPCPHQILCATHDFVSHKETCRDVFERLLHRATQDSG